MIVSVSGIIKNYTPWPASERRFIDAIRVILLLKVIVLKCCCPTFALIVSGGEVGVGFVNPKIKLLEGDSDKYEKAEFVGGVIQPTDGTV